MAASISHQHIQYETRIIPLSQVPKGPWKCLYCLMSKTECKNSKDATDRLLLLFNCSQEHIIYHAKCGKLALKEKKSVQSTRNLSTLKTSSIGKIA